VEPLLPLLVLVVGEGEAEVDVVLGDGFAVVVAVDDGDGDVDDGAGVEEVVGAGVGAELGELGDVEIGAVVTRSIAGCLPMFSFEAQDHRVPLVVLVTSVSRPDPVTALVTSAWA
jgi:hypothetical protein